MSETVWLKGSGIGNPPAAFHRSKECYYMESANRVRRKDLEALPDGIHVCRVCGEGPDYHDEDWLREQYRVKGLTSEEIADVVGRSSSTIQYWLKKHGIEMRARGRRTNRACYSVHSNGYMVWISTCDSKRNQVYVHRLLAVAEYGFEAVAGNIVHHENGCKFDNRPDNIEVMSQSEHASQHNTKLTWLDRLRVAELYRNGDVTTTDLGEMFGVDGSHISRVKNAITDGEADDDE